jgi:hypothetical protein
VRLVVRWAPPTWNFSVAAVWRNYLRCMVLGHDGEIVAGDGVIALRCRQCGWRSSGWHLDPRVNRPLRSRHAATPAPRVPVGFRAEHRCN